MPGAAYMVSNIFSANSASWLSKVSTGVAFVRNRGSGWCSIFSRVIFRSSLRSSRSLIWVDFFHVSTRGCAHRGYACPAQGPVEGASIAVVQENSHLDSSHWLSIRAHGRQKWGSPKLIIRDLMQTTPLQSATIQNTFVHCWSNGCVKQFSLGRLSITANPDRLI